MRRLGVVVNPVAGLGGRAGLKGTDGPEALSRARSLGIEPESPRRALAALSVVAAALGDTVQAFAAPGMLGEDEANQAGLQVESVGETHPGESTARDTIEACQRLRELDVDLLVFAGGDGTARDVYDAIGTTVPAIGIPTGVKMHSAVHARNPRAAGELAVRFLRDPRLPCRELEVMDIDEEAFRAGRVSARLYGVLSVPYTEGLLQGLKVGSSAVARAELDGIAREVIARMTGDRLFLLGPGTTTRAITDALGLPKTLLGIDVVAGGSVVATDVNEADLLLLLEGREAEIVVTPIGGQGFIFGRGSQQFSPVVIRKVGRDHIIVVATNAKLAALGGAPLLVDTGDENLDRKLSGYVRVITGWRVEAVCQVAN